VLYVCSRVVASFLPRAFAAPAKGSGTPLRPIPPESRTFSAFAAVCWGLVMYLFRERGETLQAGMFNSMNYLYLDSNRWDGLRTLVWHNT
jgi:peroxisomal membrane protein 4